MFVRWLGAFRKGSYTLAESIDYEFSQADLKEPACEKFTGESKIGFARVGLLCNPENIIKNFKGDCWSEYDGNSLRKTRNPKTAKSKHLESWVAGKNCSTGIVIKIPVEQFKKDIQEQIIASTKMHNVPVYILKEGKNAKLLEVKF